MNKIKPCALLSFLLLLLICISGSAQDTQGLNLPLDPQYRKSFNKDSLRGFDEVGARVMLLQQGVFGNELIVALYNYKTTYINNKYTLNKPYIYTPDPLSQNRPVSPGCVNEDFEASPAAQITTSNQIAGWTVTKGYNGSSLPGSGPQATINPFYPNGIPLGQSSCNMTLFPVPPNHSNIIDCSAAGGFVDNQIGAQYPIYSVFGSGPANATALAANPQLSSPMFGGKVIRLNDGITGDYSIERLSKTFAVTGQNALFQFAFISVFNTSHDCCAAGGFVIRLSNATTSAAITCPNFSVSAPGAECGGNAGTPNYKVALSGVNYTYSLPCPTCTPPTFGSSNGSVIYNPWQVNSMDLTAYIGQNITIDIIASDCIYSGHYGKCYFDAQCGPMTINGNGNIYDAGTEVTVPTCGAAGATICAAAGLGPYSWAGQGLPPGYSAVSMTNQCLVTSVSAQYTVYMQPAGSCAPIQRVVNSTVTPAPLVSGSVLQAVCGATQAVVSVTPSGSALNPSTLIWSPTPLSLSSNSITGTYVIPSGNTPLQVTVVASDPLGCKVTETLNINPAPPIPSFTIVNTTGSQSITCDYPVINLDALTTYSYNNGFLNYFWASNSATFATSSISVINPGTYTVNGVDPVTNCIVVRTVAIGVNTVAPMSTSGPQLQTITCGTVSGSIQNVTLTATNPVVNITHQILAPQGGTFSSNSSIDYYTPGGVGTFSYCLKNNSNGCSTCKEFTVNSLQGFPTFQVTSPANNFTLGCSSRSCAVIKIENGQTTPFGGGVTYTVLSPGSSTSVPVTLSSQTDYTVCAFGNYTVITKDLQSQCETRTPITILTNTFAPSIATLYERNTLDCNTRTVTLRGVSTNTYVEYMWMYQGGSANTVVADTITASNNPSTPTKTLVNTYTLVITDLSSTCKSFATVPIYQNLFPPKAGASPITSSLSCITQSLTFSNQSSTGIPLAIGFPTASPVVGFLWEGPTPQVPKSNSTTYVGQVPGIYTLTAKDINNGCTAIATMTVIDNQIYPDISPTVPTGTLDCGAVQTNLTVNFTPSIYDGKYAFDWSSDGSQIVGDQTKNPFPVSSPGVYDVLVTNTITGCSAKTRFAVINGSLTATFEPSDVTGYAPKTISFTNLSASSNGTNNIQTFWNFANAQTSGTVNPTTGLFVSTSISSSVSPTALYTQAGTYTVTIYSTKGTCIASAQRIIKLDIPSALEIPNVFTPNNDGINDIFWVKSANLIEITAVIFDRWGHKVYEITSTTGNIAWDGKNLYGKDAAEGTYFYNIKATGDDGVPYTKKGTINLYR